MDWGSGGGVVSRDAMYSYHPPISYATLRTASQLKVLALRFAVTDIRASREVLSATCRAVLGKQERIAVRSGNALLTPKHGLATAHSRSASTTTHLKISHISSLCSTVCLLYRGNSYA